MTPKPPSSAGGSSLPPRRRPSHGATDITEADLWAFDDELAQPLDETTPEVRPAGPVATGIPGRREPQVPKARAEAPADQSGNEAVPSPADMRSHKNVNKGRQPAEFTARPSRPENEFDDLDEGESAMAPPESAKSANIPAADVPTIDLPEADLPDVTQPAAPEVAVSAAPVTAPAVADAQAAASLGSAGTVAWPRLKLSKLERLGLLVFLVLLLGGGAAMLGLFFSRVPASVDRSKDAHFPLKGSHLTVQSATTYWRAPVVNGPNADVSRRGTALLPVLELNVSGGSGAIRVLFRNDERSVVGDVVTRTVDGQGTLQIPATAGFGEIGMHAAYCTGEGKPWTVEVYEAPSSQAAGAAIKPLFELNVSTNRR